MKKRLFTTILIGILAICLTLPVLAAEPSEAPERAPGQCGETVFWTYHEGRLVISGEGKMDDFAKGEAPWEAQRKEIKEVLFNGGVTYVGAYSFYDYDALETVDFGDAMHELGEGSFYGCDGLTEISLPRTFKIFGPDSLRSCRNLKAIHCEGVFPSFRLNSLWDTYATIYYPADRPWGVQYIQQLEEAFKGRIEFIASDGTDHYQPTEATEATEVTEEPTEETTEATEEATVPPTQLPTEAPTEAATEETPEPTKETEETPPATEAATEPEDPEEPEQKPAQSWIPLAIIGVVVAFLLIGAGVTMLKGDTGRRNR